MLFEVETLQRSTFERLKYGTPAPPLLRLVYDRIRKGKEVKQQ